MLARASISRKDLQSVTWSLWPALVSPATAAATSSAVVAESNMPTMEVEAWYWAVPRSPLSGGAAVEN